MVVVECTNQVREHGSLLVRPTIKPDETYKELKKLQNNNWARESLRLGVVHAKRGSKEDLESALKFYKHAIDIDPTFSDSYTARGAAFVLLCRYEDALADFASALRFNPQARMGFTPITYRISLVASCIAQLPSHFLTAN
jgi:tetratricopeptide (TPR) repeat protein